MLRRIYTLFVCLSPLFLFGQNDFENRWTETQNQWLIQTFKSTYPDYSVLEECPPNLAFEIPEASNLDQSLEPFRQNKALESECIQLYFQNNCAGYKTVKLLSDLYFPLFERHLVANDIEEDFKFLAVVQSGLNAHFDDGANKAGLWGLDLPRARKSGLIVNRTIDERKAPDLSTQKAVSFLKELKERYDDDALKMTVAFLRGIPYADQFDPKTDKDRQLQFQLTLLHVSIRLYKHTSSNNSLMKWLELLNEYEAIPIKQDASFSAISAVLGAEKDLLGGLNPTFVGRIAKGEYRNVPFLVPKELTEEWLLVEDSVYCYKPPQEVLQEQEKAEASRVPERDITEYTVRSGDVLGKIAERFGVRVRDIKDWNNLRSDRIDVGQKLIVYSPAAKPKPQAKPKNPPKTTTNNGTAQIYTVKSGDSLWLIARNFPGVSAENIMEWNNITDDIRPGQQLKIYAE